MIYFDNAATALARPDTVASAVSRAIGEFGGVGRGVHEASLAASMAVYRAREQVAALLGARRAGDVSFSLNATHALNIAIEGLLRPGDHAITSAASHNSVLRPLYRKRDQGCGLSILPVASDGAIDYDAFADLFEPATRIAVMTHASNLTGDVYDIARMAAICHAQGALLVVDVAQTAGLIPLDMEREGLDLVAFTGHKSLLGPQGTGGLCVREGIEVPPYIVGGTGSHSFDERHPAHMPEALEAGTLNSHGIAGLSAGLEYIEQMGVPAIREQTLDLAERFEAGVSVLPGVVVYGGHAGVDRCGIVALNIGELDPSEVSDRLSTEYGIATRAGTHCAPLMHRALGTADRGLVRFSFSHFNTAEEIDQGIEAVSAIASGK